MNIELANHNKLRQSFDDYHKYGGKNMNYIGFECIDKHLKFPLDGIIDLTGYPASGKSEFALELMFYQSESFGLRHLIYAPDIGNYNEIRRKLLTKYCRKTFRGEGGITNTDILHASAWIDTHFLIAVKRDYTKPIEPKMLWDFTAQYEDQNGIINTCYVDAWKNLFHQYTGREDLYLDYILSYRNEVAEQSKRTFITVAHPSKTEIEKPINGEKPKRRIPDANDIKGGGAWFANGKNIITVDYPDKSQTFTDIFISKVKPDVLGRPGVIMQKIEFDWRKSRYRETIMGEIFYAGEAKKKYENTPTPF